MEFQNLSELLNFFSNHSEINSGRLEEHQQAKSGNGSGNGNESGKAKFNWILLTTKLQQIYPKT